MCLFVHRFWRLSLARVRQGCLRHGHLWDLWLLWVGLFHHVWALLLPPFLSLMCCTVLSPNHQRMQPPANAKNHWGASMRSMTTWAMTAAKMMVTAGLVTARKKLVKTSTRLGLLEFVEFLELFCSSGMLTPFDARG